MRKVDDGEKKKKKKEKKKEKKEKNGVFSGHYVIASSLPPERLRPNDDRWNAACSCQYWWTDRVLSADCVCKPRYSHFCTINSSCHA